jgi:hypothetical protein
MAAPASHLTLKEPQSFAPGGHALDDRLFRFAACSDHVPLGCAEEVFREQEVRRGKQNHHCEFLPAYLLLRPESSSSRLSSFKKSVLVALALCFVGANLCRAPLTEVRKRCASS